jgi:phage terminase small subunit
MASLTQKQQRFIEEYLVDANATQAAIRAGYSERTAYSQGQRLLKNVEVRIALEVGRAKMAGRTEVTADRVREEQARIGFADIRDLMSWSHDRVTFKPSADLTPAQAAAIASVKSKTTTFTREDGTTEQRIELELKLHDKGAALDRLAKILGMYVERTQNYDFDPDDFTDDGLLRISRGEDPLIVLTTGGAA